MFLNTNIQINLNVQYIHNYYRPISLAAAMDVYMFITYAWALLIWG